MRNYRAPSNSLPYEFESVVYMASYHTFSRYFPLLSHPRSATIRLKDDGLSRKRIILLCFFLFLPFVFFLSLSFFVFISLSIHSFTHSVTLPIAQFYSFIHSFSFSPSRLFLSFFLCPFSLFPSLCLSRAVGMIVFPLLDPLKCLAPANSRPHCCISAFLQYLLRRI